MDKKIAREIIDEIILRSIVDGNILDNIKRKIAKKYSIADLIPNSSILEHAKSSERDRLKILIKKPVRTISGVVIVAVMSKPGICPGKCIYCPQGENVPKSYTGLEPAARRGAMFEYDPYNQVMDRIKQLTAIGHATEKIELIIMGGTFLSYATDYKVNFVKRLFDALNGVDSDTLENAKKLNETAEHRCVGLTIETRPDFCREKEIDEMLLFGATRVELGVQSLSDEVFKKVNRGHTVADVALSTKLLKDSGFKIVYHMMPGLMQKKQEDIKMFETLFSDERFCPDMLKIYPTLVIKGTKLYDMWKNGEYSPLDTKSAADIIAHAKKKIPSYVRVMRVQRDIPKEKIDCGVENSNLREYVVRRADVLGIKCRCIRCREAGHKMLHGDKSGGNKSMCVLEYDASGSKEYFISYEDKKNDILYGYVRLRIVNDSFRSEFSGKMAVVRELKVVGTSLALGDDKIGAYQHKGLGVKLMARAQEIAKENGVKKILVISAVGTKEYYRKLGYKDVGVYVGKEL
ncbi:tRNA uridine(34) 5-carboxymethylaminomethyl modification radical SAM/GNAT enzyme Elp3 [archaeon]|nr:tRNA uridine(34) 5-carboxymethylaminomethyl modification radical SAM/GNAT enzyme Elp3 [archaeon]